MELGQGPNWGCSAKEKKPCYVHSSCDAVKSQTTRKETVCTRTPIRRGLPLSKLITINIVRMMNRKSSTGQCFRVSHNGGVFLSYVGGIVRMGYQSGNSGSE
jgi:hypothetical protein